MTEQEIQAKYAAYKASINKIVENTNTADPRAVMEGLAVISHILLENLERIEFKIGNRP